jgi:uncharacterized membrane protein (UPF0127 family)
VVTVVKEKIVVKYKGKRISVDVSRCALIGKGIGLMFSRKERAKVLLFDFNYPSRMGIHSYFVFFDFIAVWVDEDDNVVQVDCVKPWTSFLCPKKRYVKLIEIPINKKNEKLVGKFC